MPTIPPNNTFVSDEQEHPWPDSYPVENVETTFGITLPSVDQAEYTDLRRQRLIKFDEPTTPAAPAQNEQE